MRCRFLNHTARSAQFARAMAEKRENPDDGQLDPGEFDAEAGRDVHAELDYIRSGREKRNSGC